MSTPLQGEPSGATPPATIPPPPPEALAVARQLAAVLGETEEKPIMQMARAVATLGPDKATGLSEEALTVAAGEGILTKDKATGEMRKRTPGGTFFALVRKEVGEKAWRKKIKPVLSQKKVLAVNLGEQFAVIREAASRQNFKAGDTSKVELTLTGTPLSVQKQQTFVALSFIDKDAAPPLPKGVPTLERKGTSKAEAKPGDTTNGTAEQQPAKGQGGTRYLVLVATKQWDKIEEALKHNKNDKLVIKGYSLVQPNFAGIVVLAYQANTVGLLSAKRG